MKKLENVDTAIVVGNGSLAQKLTRKLMTSEFGKVVIIVSIGNYKKIMESYLYSQSGLPIYTNLQAISSARSIVFAFDQVESENVLNMLRHVKFNTKQEYEIISFVPDLSKENIERSIPMCNNFSITRADFHGGASGSMNEIIADKYSDVLNRLGVVSVWPTYSI
jgi:pyrroline-5-carboxylate reductase